MNSKKHFKSCLAILTITAALAVQAHAQSWLTNGLLAYYPFNGNANDESGNGNTLTNNGAVLATDRFGIANHCVSFVTNSMSGPVAGIPLGASPRTMSFWFATTNHSNSTGSLVTSAVDQTSARFGAVVFYGNPYLDCDNNDLRGSAYITDGRWHHMAITYTNSTASIYVDGKLDSSASKSLNTASAPLVLGNGTSTYVGSNYYNGLLDDVRIYNRSLSASEVQALYQYEAPPCTSSHCDRHRDAQLRVCGWRNRDRWRL